MKKHRLWFILAATICLIVIAAFALDHFLDANTYRGRIEAALSQSLGRPVQLGHLSFSIFTGSLDASSLSVADNPAFSRQPFLTARDVRIGVRIWPLIFDHQLHITGITVDQPTISLLHRGNGTWNYASLGGKRQPASAQTGAGSLLPNLTVSRLLIRNGAITIATLPASGPPRVYHHVTVTARNFSFAHAFPFTVSASLPGGGSMNLQGNAGPIHPGNAAATPLTAKLTLKKADLAKQFLSSSQGIAGNANLNADIRSDGHTANVDGTLHITQLKLAKDGKPSSQPVSLRFTVDQNIQAMSGNIRKANLQIGKAAMAVHGTYQSQGNATRLNLTAAGQNMPIDSLVAFLPSLGVQLPPGSRLQGGTLTTSLHLTGTAAAPIISGPVRIRNTRLAGFDLGKKLAAIQALTGARTGSSTTIQLLSTDLHRSPGGTQTNNLTAIVTGVGTATGSGSISPSGALNYHLKVKLASSGVGGLARKAAEMLPGALGASLGQSMKNGVPVRIQGTTAHPVFQPELGKMFSGSSRQKTTPQKQNPLKKALQNILGKKPQP